MDITIFEDGLDLVLFDGVGVVRLERPTPEDLVIAIRLFGVLATPGERSARRLIGMSRRGEVSFFLPSGDPAGWGAVMLGTDIVPGISTRRIGGMLVRFLI